MVQPEAALADAKGIFGELEERQFGRWTLRHNGLEGGTVFDVAFRPGDGNVAYAGTVLGVFRSDDGGQSWQASRTGLLLQTGGDGIAFNPDNPDEMFIGTLAGPFVSRDAGLTWLPLNAAPANGTVHGIIVDPNDSDHLIGVGRQNPPAYLESLDRGQSWVRKEIPVFGTRGILNAFAFDPSDSDRIYAGVTSFGADIQGVARSGDGGQSWELIRDGLLNGQGDNDFDIGIRDLVVDPGDGATIFAAGSCGGLFRSENAGDTWVRVHRFGCEEDVDIDPANPNRVVSSNGVSLDGGDSWQPSLQGQRVEAVAIKPGSGTDLLAGLQDASTFVSANNGVTWDQTGSGLDAANVPDVAFVDADTAFAAANQFGIYRTTDRGLNWAPVTSPLGVDYYAITMATDPRFGYAGSRVGVVRTQDSGATWQLADTGMEFLRVEDVAVDSTDPMRVFAAVRQGGMSDVYRSLDGGDTWTPTNVPIQGNSAAVNEVEIDPVTPSIVYAGIFDDGESPTSMVYRSIDGGDSWTATDSAIDGRFGITALAIDPDDPTILYAGKARDGLFKSTNSGGAWFPLPGFGDVRDIAIDADDPRRLFAGSRLSEDGGVNRAVVGPNLPDVVAGTFVPGLGDVLFLTGFRGVFERRLQENRERLDADLSAADRFGTSVAITESFVFVGLPGDDEAGQDAGAVIVYERTDEGTVERQRLTVPDGFSAVNFGSAVAVDGDTLVIGAPDPSGDVSKGPSGLQAAIFERLAQGWTFKTPLNPVEGEPGDEFGRSVAIVGGMIAVGAPGDSDDAGAAYVFEFASGIVAPSMRVDPPVAGAGRFGQALTVKQDVLAVGRPGAPLNNALNGAVDLYDLLAANLAPLGTVNPDSQVAGDEFGASVTLEGDALWVGAPGAADDEGRVFRFDLVSRLQQEVLTARIPERASRFGFSVTGGGESLVVGAPSQLTPQGRSGEATVFEPGEGVTQLIDVVVPDDELFEFGGAVAALDQGIIIGAPGTADDRGAALLLSPEEAIFGSGFETVDAAKGRRYRVTDRSSN